MLERRGVDVWFEIDLVAAWQEGQVAFDQAVARIRRLSAVPGVIGFKIADELGYADGIDSAGQAIKFLGRAGAALQRVAPDAEVLVDMVVPELGCMPWRPGREGVDCARQVVAAYPAASADVVGRYLRTGVIDVLDLSTGLLDPATYRAWGLTRLQAQDQAWAHVVRAGWGQWATLQARKALAERGGYGGDDKQAQSDIATFVDVPTTHGAEAVDIWTWRQAYDGSTVSLLADDSATNPLWSALAERRREGVSLFTHMTPSALTQRWSTACDRVAEIFDSVFVAAGTS